MNRRDAFLGAMQLERYRDFHWVIGAFSLTQPETPDSRVPTLGVVGYDVVRQATAYFVVDPADVTQQIKIDGAPITEPLFYAYDEIHLKQGDLPNLTQDITTTYGNVLLNYLVCIWPFGAKIPFITGKFGPEEVETEILKRWKTGSEKDKERKTDQIYYDEYLNYTDAAMFAMQLTQLFVPSGSEKTLTFDPAVRELRATLLKQYAGQLHDPSVIARIDAELIAHDKAWMKGDISEGYFVSSKQFNIVRKKLFSHTGAEKGLLESNDVEAIHTSLDEGIRPQDFAVMNNTIRAGSLNRGSFTQYGGEAYKWLIRATTNLTINKEDCGSTVGIERRLSKPMDRWIGRTVLAKDGALIPLTDANVASYENQTVAFRSPQFCRVASTGFCRTCLGELLSISETGLSGAVAQAFGSEFLNQFLKSAHAKALVLADIDLNEVIL
jgi:hypothetical protein